MEEEPGLRMTGVKYITNVGVKYITNLLRPHRIYAIL